MTDILAHRTAAARALLRCSGKLLVALSGGVDSAVLLALAADTLGRDRVLAVTGDSPSLARDDLEDARAVARHVGVCHEVVPTGELGRPAYRANRGDRCFHCRSELFAVLGRLARERGIADVAYGAIRDDLGDFRPGMRAADEHGVRAPLLEAGLGKSEVRRLAAEFGLPIRDKPAAACLASRLPVGTTVTAERLRQVERAERALERLGFRQLRVRHHGPVARLELDEAGFALLGDPELRRAVADAVRAAGFAFVALDLDGYRTGSLNPPAERRPSTTPNRDGGQ